MPTVFYAFDILHLLGMNLRGAAYEDRQRYLSQCLMPLSNVQPVHTETDAYALYQASIAAGLEGIVSKKADSIYEPGRRSPYWLKVKAVQTGEFVIGGFTAGEGHRRDEFGALLLGYWDEGAKLRYAGHVGSGFNDRTLAEIRKRLAALKTGEKPFATEPDLHAPTTWVRPALVAEVQYHEWTPSGTLRAPVFLRLRDDVDVKSVRRRDVAGTTTRNDSTDVVTSVLRQLATKETSLSLQVGAHRIGVSQLDKTLWPAHKKWRAATKGDLLRYLASMAPYMLPHLANRPLTLIRMPDGIYGESFFQKHLTQKLPPFVETVEVYSKSKTENHAYPLCNNLATLLWLGQLGTLEFHVWHSSLAEPGDRSDYSGSLAKLEASALNYPDYVVFDIDPYIYSGKEAPGAEPEFNRKAFEAGKTVAFWLKELLDALSLRSFVKTSGKTGLHIFVPIARTLTFVQARSVCELIGRHLMAQHPDVITMDWSVDKRPGKIFFDHNMNARGKTLNVAYSPRGVPGAPVSMPVTWEELPGVQPPNFRMDNAPKLMAARGDVWRDLHTTRQSVEAALKMSTA